MERHLIYQTKKGREVTLLELLKRLDTAIGKAWDEDEFTDELNG